MVKAKVTNTFSCKGQTYTPGMVVRFPEDDLEALTGYVEVLPNQSLTRYEKILQQRSTDSVRFCLSHENTFPDGHCPVKRNRLNPLRHCVGYQIKNKRAIH